MNQVLKEQEVKYREYVIDSSIVNYYDMEKELYKIFYSYSKMIVDKACLNMMRKRFPTDSAVGKNIQLLLNMVYQNSEKFKSIKDAVYSIDDVIEYCKLNKDNVTLITTNTVLERVARKVGIHCIVFSKDSTPFYASVVDGHYVISNFRYENIVIRVCSNGVEYDSGERQLFSNDDVFVLEDKQDYMVFKHYKIYDGTTYELMFLARIYDVKEIKNLNASYKAFIKSNNML